MVPRPLKGKELNPGLELLTYRPQSASLIAHLTVTLQKLAASDRAAGPSSSLGLPGQADKELWALLGLTLSCNPNTNANPNRNLNPDPDLNPNPNPNSNKRGGSPNSNPNPEPEPERVGGLPEP